MVMNPNVSHLIAQIWEDVVRDSPDPWRNPSPLNDYGGMSYRERLDWQPLNYYGEKIPRIVTVRNNLRRQKLRGPKRDQW